MRAREYIDTPDMGCWIEPNGNVHECDHRSDRHHADIALELFDIETTEDGEYDDYSREDAIEAALDDGWLRISAIDTMGFSMNWREDSLTPQQIAAALKVLKKAKNLPFDSYNIDTPATGFLGFDNFRKFVATFRRLAKIPSGGPTL